MLVLGWQPGVSIVDEKVRATRRMGRDTNYDSAVLTSSFVKEVLIRVRGYLGCVRLVANQL